MFRPRHLALIAALALAAPTLAWAAEPQGRGGPPWSRGDDRGYANGRYSRSAGFQTGLDDGYEAGVNDARGRRRYDPISERRYRSADHRYDRRYGPKELYKNAYREGFKDGYERGYRDGRRYDDRRRDDRGRDRGGFFFFGF
jgi:hypothetical protein